MLAIDSHVEMSWSNSNIWIKDIKTSWSVESLSKLNSNEDII